MELIKTNVKEELHFSSSIVAVLGQFDGLHIAHVKLIEKAIQIGKERQMKVAVYTFDPHPDYILKKRQNLGYITPLSQKIDLMSSLGVDYLVIIHFDLELSQLSPNVFIDKFLQDAKVIVVGSDYRFGYKGMGNMQTFQEYGKEVVALDILNYNNEKIASNKIRELLENGEVDKIYNLLNRYYSIVGKVSYGSQVGRTLGVRTANIELSDDYQIIKRGVYIVKVRIKKKEYAGVCNIGINPSINTVSRMRLEVHILDFNEDIYGQEVSIDFIKRIRDEIHFPTPEALKEQINHDIASAKTFFGENK